MWRAEMRKELSEHWTVFLFCYFLCTCAKFWKKRRRIRERKKSCLNFPSYFRSHKEIKRALRSSGKVGGGATTASMLEIKVKFPMSFHPALPLTENMQNFHKSSSAERRGHERENISSTKSVVIGKAESWWQLWGFIDACLCAGKLMSTLVISFNDWVMVSVVRHSYSSSAIWIDDGWHQANWKIIFSQNKKDLGENILLFSDFYWKFLDFHSHSLNWIKLSIKLSRYADIN